MAYYCGECAVWRGSSDTNKYGERWCSYSRRYEKSDQNTYGCRGFVYDRSNQSGCFLTTACVSHKGLPDHCHELTTLRAFRDNWLSHQPFGKSEIEEYYHIAPYIVKAINQDKDASNLWERMYDECILVCVRKIESGDMQGAYVQYKQLISELCMRFSTDDTLGV